MSVLNWAQGVFTREEVEDAPAQLAVHAEHIVQLQHLYGKNVLPDALMKWFPLHLRHPHVVQGHDVAALTAEGFAEAFTKEVLVSEEHPVVTRFWLFAQCVRHVLTISLLGNPAEMFELGGLVPMQKQARRLRLVTLFFKDPIEQQRLKAAVLSLRLTRTMLAVTARKPSDQQPPVLLELTGNEIPREAAKVFIEIVSAFGADNTLDKVLAITALCTTLVHLVVRCLQPTP